MLNRYQGELFIVTVLGLGAGHLIFDILLKWDWEDPEIITYHGKGAVMTHLNHMHKSHDNTNIEPCCSA